jgi:hypothetical protein
MASETMTVTAVTAPIDPRPYSPSWVNALIRWIEGLPGPTWAAWVVLSVVMVIGSNAQAWSSGQGAVGEFDATATYWGLYLVAVVWLVGYLDRVAGRAFDAFRPALSLPTDELVILRYKLSVIPARPAILFTVGGAVLTVAYYVLDPVSSQIGGLSPTGLLIRAASEIFSSAVLLVIVFQLIRQLRLVNTIMASAPKVDLFDPGPLYAFSKLTSRTGIAVILLMGSATLVAPPPTTEASVLVVWLPWLVGLPLLAAAAFVLPLLGMHGRLVDEKERLQGEAATRLKLVMAKLDHDVDAGDLARADGLNKTLASVLQQRDVIGRLPTWPWSTATLRAFVTAIFLPLLIFLLQRLLGQLV